MSAYHRNDGRNIISMKWNRVLTIIFCDIHGHGPWTFKKLLVFLIESGTYGVMEKLQITTCLSQKILKLHYPKVNTRINLSLHFHSGWTMYTIPWGDFCFCLCDSMYTAWWLGISPVIHIHNTWQWSTLLLLVVDRMIDKFASLIASCHDKGILTFFQAVMPEM